VTSLLSADSNFWTARQSAEIEAALGKTEARQDKHSSSHKKEEARVTSGSCAGKEDGTEQLGIVSVPRARLAAQRRLTISARIASSIRHDGSPSDYVKD